MAVRGDLYKEMYSQATPRDRKEQEEKPRSYGYQSVQSGQDQTPTSPTASAGYSQAKLTTPGNSDVSMNDLYEQRLGLAESLAAEQRRISQEAANYKRESLSDQLDQQRRQYQQGLQMMNEQGYNRGSQLLNQLANRGLATSGLIQLGDAQNKMAQGQGLSELAYQDRMGRENINQAQRQTESTLAQQLRQAELDRAQTEMGAEEQLYGRQMQQEQMQKEEMMFMKDQALARAAREVETGVITPEQYATIQDQVMAMNDLESLETYLTAQGIEPQEGGGLAETIAGAGRQNILGGSNVEFNEPGFFAKQFGSGSYVGATVDPNKVDESTFDRVAEDNQLTLSNGVAINFRDALYLNEDSPGTSRIALNNELASESLKEKYQGFDNYENIAVNLFSDDYGSIRSKPFGVEKPNGDIEWFNTWNDASKYYDEQSKSW